jgi:hypothetical protein
MKRILYILVIAVSTLSLATSCTDENVAPKTEADNGGGSGDEPIKKN